MLVLFLCLIARFVSHAQSFDQICADLPSIQNEKVVNCIEPLCSSVEQCPPTLMQDMEALGDHMDKIPAYCGSGCLHGLFDAFTYFAPCFQRATGQTLDGLPTDADFGEQIDNMCSQNPLNAKYCVISLQDSTPLNSEFTDNGFNNYTAEETQIICGAISELGCCFTTMVEFGSWGASMDGTTNNEYTVAEVEDKVRSLCGWKNLAKPCGKFGETRKSIQVALKADILWSDWSSMSEHKKLAAQYAATQDLKSTLGLDLFASGFTKSADGKVVLNFNVDSTNDPALEQSIKQTLGSQVPEWSNLEAAINVPAVTTTDSQVIETEVTHQFPDSSYRKMPGFFVLSSVLFLWTLF